MATAEPWTPSAIQMAEVVLAGTEAPVKPAVATQEDFTKLWNRVVHMDKAVLELIEHYRSMKVSLDESRQALEAKQERITSLEKQVSQYRGEVLALGNKQAEHDDRINWLET